MPQYLYENPNDGSIVEVIQTMNEPHIYEVNGVKYNRVFTIPQGAIDCKIDPFSSKDFAEKTGKKRGTLGNLFDQSAELSEKRAQKAGADPLKQAYYDRYKKIRGREHNDIGVKKAKEKLAKLGVSYE